jgi:hypothetical protein
MLDFDPAHYAAFLVASLPGLAAAPLAQGRLGCLDAALDAEHGTQTSNPRRPNIG